MYINWIVFPNKRGMVSGLNAIGPNLYAIIFSFIALKIVNPENKFPTIEVNNVKYFEEDVAKNVVLML